MIRQALAEGVAPARPGRRLFQTHAAQGLHGRGHAQALAVEVGHNDPKPLVFFADQMIHGHAHIVEIQRGRVRGPPPLLALQGGARKPFGIGGN